MRERSREGVRAPGNTYAENTFANVKEIFDRENPKNTQQVSEVKEIKKTTSPTPRSPIQTGPGAGQTRNG